MRSSAASPYSASSRQSHGFISRHMRKLSSSLPHFTTHPLDSPLVTSYSAPQRQPSTATMLLDRLRSVYRRLGRKLRMRILLGFLLYLCFSYLYAREYDLLDCAIIGQ